jgi:hypothetical protein
MRGVYDELGKMISTIDDNSLDVRQKLQKYGLSTDDVRLELAKTIEDQKNASVPKGLQRIFKWFGINYWDEKRKNKAIEALGVSLKKSLQETQSKLNTQLGNEFDTQSVKVVDVEKLWSSSTT